MKELCTLSSSAFLFTLLVLVRSTTGFTSAPVNTDFRHPVRAFISFPSAQVLSQITKTTGVAMSSRHLKTPAALSTSSYSIDNEESQSNDALVGSVTKKEDDKSSNNPAEALPNGIFLKIRRYFRGPNDGLSFRQRMTKMGLAVALSYGWISNMSYSVSVSLAWYIFSKQVSLFKKKQFVMLVLEKRKNIMDSSST